MRWTCSVRESTRNTVKLLCGNYWNAATGGAEEWQGDMKMHVRMSPHAIRYDILSKIPKNRELDSQFEWGDVQGR